MRLTIEDEITSLEGARFRVRVEPAPAEDDRSIWLTVRRPPAPWPVLRERWVSRDDADSRAQELKDTLTSGERQLSFAPALQRSRVQSRPTPTES